MGTQSIRRWKTRIMFVLAILLLGVGIQAAPQDYDSSYQSKCSYQPKEECTTIYENVERNVTYEVCHTEYSEECHREYIMGECHTEYEQECHEVPTVKQVKLTELKCTTDQYGEETCKNIERYEPVPGTEEKCEKKAHEVCDKPETICEVKPHDVCYNVVTKKTEKVPRKHCKTVQKNVCD